VPALHAMTATHAHRYCLTHQLFEEEPLDAGGHRRPPQPTASDTRRITREDDVARLSRLHFPCTLSNWTPGRSVAPSTQRVATVVAALPNVGSQHDGSAPHAFLVLIQAPKHSPPAHTT
jgi:hypothetical protein